MIEKEYSAGLVSKPFWYSESRQTAELMSQGKSRAQIRDLAINENIYQRKEEYRAVEIFTTTYRRLSTLPMELIQRIATADRGTSKMLLIVALMLDDRLFCEFMGDSYRVHLRSGDYQISSRDLIRFFSYKSSQSDKVAGWSDLAKRKLMIAYMKILSEAELATPKTDTEWIIRPAVISGEVLNIMKMHSLDTYAMILSGDAL